MELTLSLLLLSPEGDGERRTCTGALRLTRRVTGDRDRAIAVSKCAYTGRLTEYIYRRRRRECVCPLGVSSSWLAWLASDSVKKHRLADTGRFRLGTAKQARSPIKRQLL